MIIASLTYKILLLIIIIPLLFANVFTQIYFQYFDTILHKYELLEPAPENWIQFRSFIQKRSDLPI